MKIIINLGFLTDVAQKATIGEILNRFGVAYQEPPEPPSFAAHDRTRSYRGTVAYDPERLAQLVHELNDVGVRLLGYHYSFRVDDAEYESAPLYRLQGVGNARRAYIPGRGTEYRFDSLCPACDVKAREQVSPLKFNTRWLSGRDAAYIDYQFLVISERLAALLAEHGLTGYELRPVVHVGPAETERRVYQLVPTNVLPPWSGQMPIIDPEWMAPRQCPVCRLTGRLLPPFHYDGADLGRVCDFNLTQEYEEMDRGLVGRRILVSARFRRLVLERGWVLDDWKTPNKPGSSYWHFEPIIVV